MDGHTRPEVMPRAHAPARDPAALDRLALALGPGPFAAVLLFVSPEADRLAVQAGLAAGAFGGAPVIGCTTAGEISAEGYAEGEIVAVGLPAATFAAEVLEIDLTHIDGQGLIGRMIRARAALADRHPVWQGEFAFLMVDGLSIREDELTAALGPGLGPVPLFGGSAGDGLRFGQTFVLSGGRFRQGAAVLAMIRTACLASVFSLDHLVPTDRRMVVTGADPARRVVHQINAEPAAREYARLLGKDPAQLTAFTFAAHPVVVRIGGRHHVRAIQRMAPNGDLVFFSAIDEGLVLTLAEPMDMADHLDAALTELSADARPSAILACDCLLRRIEAQEKQRFGAVSSVLRAHGVAGFSTYGEQWNSMHVNQTMTGVALWAPEAGP
ncbi:FIST C-terminal domain-containing protein [Rhodobacter sp. Har01]|uniref:FIST N-terminal domain-containing protein n=1 Tax=Rhodobacter sp. Har01 TaxID=2883999 RepID=UPI001D0912E2|nr:FIST N-terminal domain-containing protein [Rhodobacter sp. Har01]MCB6177261.1 FIST C-terminal domain-containing protein [Rhodobacter sp. Har01]